MRTPALVCVLSLPLVVAVAACSSSSPEGECVGASGDALKVCAGPTTVKGIDVSVYQGTVNWSQVKGAGVQFAFVRVSDGKNSLDTQFANNWKNTKTAGVIRGTYQFFRPSQDPIVQADLLLSQLSKNGGMQPGDLPPVLDLESTDSQPAATVVARAKQWLAHVEAALGVRPIVYTAAFMSNVIGNNFGGYTLWVANYGATCPTMPSGWTDWHFWQNADNGQVSGVTTGGVDTNVFNGNMAELLGLTLKGNTPTPATTGPVELDVDENQAFGDQGATLGSGTPSSAKEPQSAPFTPCR